MEIKQSRNSNRTRYEFGADQLHYQLQDTSGSRSFSVAYTDISRDRQTLEERNARQFRDEYETSARQRNRRAASQPVQVVAS